MFSREALAIYCFLPGTNFLHPIVICLPSSFLYSKPYFQNFFVTTPTSLDYFISSYSALFFYETALFSNSYIISLLSLSCVNFLRADSTILSWHMVDPQSSCMSYNNILWKISHFSLFSYLTYSICDNNKFMLVDLYQCRTTDSF